MIRLGDIKVHLSDAEYRAILRDIRSTTSVLKAYRTGRSIYLSGNDLALFLTTMRKPETSVEWFFRQSWSQRLANMLLYTVNMRKQHWKQYFRGPEYRCPTRFDDVNGLRQLKPRYKFFAEIFLDIQKFLTRQQQEKYQECLTLVRQKVDRFIQGHKPAGKERVPGLLETYRPAYEIDHERMYTYFLDNCIMGIDIKTVFEEMKKHGYDRERAVNNHTKEFSDSRFEIDYENLSIDESNLGFGDNSSQTGIEDPHFWNIELGKLFAGEAEEDIEIFRLRAIYGMGWEEICEEIQDITDTLKTGPSVAYRFKKLQAKLQDRFKSLDFSFSKYSPYSFQSESLL